MRKVLIEKEVYKFEELSEKSQNRIMENERCFWQDAFEMCVQDFLETNFPNSDLNYQFSLNYCQGDGFNFYGKIDIKDIISKMQFNEEEEKIFSEIEVYLYFKKHYNNKYCYSMTFKDYFYIDKILSNLEYDYKENAVLFDYSFICYENVLNKILNRLREYFIKEEKNFENLGYDMIYPSIESCIKDGTFDDYEFFENGDIFDECDEYERKV